MSHDVVKKLNTGEINKTHIFWVYVYIFGTKKLFTFKSSSFEKDFRNVANNSWGRFDGSLKRVPNCLSWLSKNSLQSPSLPLRPLFCANFTISASTYPYGSTGYIAGTEEKEGKGKQKHYKTLKISHHPFKLAYTSKSLTMYYNLSIYLYDYWWHHYHQQLKKLQIILANITNP